MISRKQSQCNTRNNAPLSQPDENFKSHVTNDLKSLGTHLEHLKSQDTNVDHFKSQDTYLQEALLPAPKLHSLSFQHGPSRTQPQSPHLTLNNFFPKHSTHFTNPFSPDNPRENRSQATRGPISEFTHLPTAPDQNEMSYRLKDVKDISTASILQKEKNKHVKTKIASRVETEEAEVKDSKMRQMKEERMKTVQSSRWDQQQEQIYLQLIEQLKQLIYSETKLTNWRDVGLMPIL